MPPKRQKRSHVPSTVDGHLEQLMLDVGNAITSIPPSPSITRQDSSCELQKPYQFSSSR